MKAVILVGGEGTRLRPLTCNTPKAMVPVLNIPFLEHVIRHLSRHGIKDMILAQGYLAQPIKKYLSDGSQLGVRLRYLVEHSPRGTAGAIKNAERYLDETFLAINGDIFTDLDITAMMEFHLERKAKATIALTPVDDPTQYGLIETDNKGRILRFLEKPTWHEVTTNMINAGTYILEPDVLAFIPLETNVSIERETYPLLLSRGEPVYAYHSSAYWLDMGTPEKYIQLHRDLLSGKCIYYTFAEDGDLFIGGQCNVHPSAQIKGSVMIGADCTIGANVKVTGPVVIGAMCTILEGAVIEDSIVWQNVRIGPRVKLKSSIVAHRCSLNAGSVVENVVLGNDMTVIRGGRFAQDSRVWPGETVG